MKKKLFTLCAALLALAMLVSACAPAATEAAAPPADMTAPQDTPVEAAPIEATPTTAPTEVPSLVGGELVYTLTFEPDTLDPQKTQLGDAFSVNSFLYSSLVTKDAQGNIAPYLAASWDISPDGLTYTFHLRQDVKFHNGDPMTAADVVWTYVRQNAPETASPNAYLTTIDTVQALDDYTVQFILKNPNYYFLDLLPLDGYLGILQQKAVEQYGDNYGRNPVGTGPFMFKEWVTGDHITLERNPDFIWGPPFANGTPPNIQDIIFRIIPEPSTVLAGLEAGEIDFAGVEPRDIKNLEATGEFDIIRNPSQGMYSYVTYNVSAAPFDDLRVRQALVYATDKQALMDIVSPNSGASIQNGPLSPSQEGYWAGIEEMGYGYDLEKAKQLMLDAGYTYNTDGMLEKDGQPFSFDLLMYNGWETSIKSAEVLQAQWKELGVDVKLQQQDLGAALTDLIEGNYEASMLAFGEPNSILLVELFHSRNIGASNFSQIVDPEIDAILDIMETSSDPAEHLQAAQDAQVRVVEQAYVLPLFTSMNFAVVSKRVKGYTDNVYAGFRLWDAYIQP